MAGTIRKRLGKGEYWIVNLCVSLTMMVWFATGLMATTVFAPEMIPLIIVGSFTLLIGMGTYLLASLAYKPAV